VKILKVLTLNFIILFISIIQNGCSSSSLEEQKRIKKSSGAYINNSYRNLFSELLNKKESEINSKIDSIFNQLFYGNNATERIYYPVDSDMAYIGDIFHKDIRSEGMSYGMMIAVQLNRKEEFDRLWKWVKTYMHKSSPKENYLAWQLDSRGKYWILSSASDGRMDCHVFSLRLQDGVKVRNF
jgi:oligosaccharide reducing-end xylanase